MVFKQLMRDPTRISNTSSTLIDIILVNSEKNIAKSLVMPLSSSDHQFFQHQTIRCRNYSKYNPESLKSDLKNFDMSPLYKTDNVNFEWMFLQNVLIDLFNKHVLIISKGVKGTLCL